MDPETLVGNVEPGSDTEAALSIVAARWTRADGEDPAVGMSRGVVMSDSRTSHRAGSAFRWPEEKSSTTTRPGASGPMARTTWDPMYPAPPETIIGMAGGGRLALGGDTGESGWFLAMGSGTDPRTLSPPAAGIPARAAAG